MFLSAGAAAASQVTHTFDAFVIIFTILIAIGLYRLAKSPYKTKFSLGFASVCMLVFVFLDVLMVLDWFGQLQAFQEFLF
ncbi:MAG TPA: hypothetical protein VF260_08745 [Bacilli bacterium]